MNRRVAIGAVLALIGAPAHAADRKKQLRRKRSRERRIQQARVDLCYDAFLDGKLSNYCNPLVESCLLDRSRQCCEWARHDPLWSFFPSAVHSCFRVLYPD